MKDRKRNPDSRKNIVFNIQSIILSVLMAISLVTIIVMGLLLYHRFKLALEKTAVDNTEATVEATVDRLNADLLDIRQILNGANYNVVQQFDISSREFSEQFSLLYETNSDKIQSLALYDPKGNLIASEPVAAEKKNVKVQTQEWYKNAEDAIENIHFSTPHIQELFEDGSYRYQWVVSLSRYVDVNKGETPETGIHLLLLFLLLLQKLYLLLQSHYLLHLDLKDLNYLRLLYLHLFYFQLHLLFSYQTL